MILLSRQYLVANCNLRLVFQSNFIFPSNSSDVQARHLKIHIDQTNQKDADTFSVQERLRLGKCRTPKSKSRSSPYPHIAENPDYSGDFDDDVTVPPLHGYQGIGYSSPLLHSPHNALERYHSLYSSFSNTNAHMDSLKDCAYTYSSPQCHFDSGQIRSCEDRFPIRDAGYLNIHANSDDEPKLNETIQLTPLSREIRNSGQCSRSSSRSDFGTPLSVHGPSSNRSESSASDVDGLPDDLDRTNSKHDSSKCLKQLHVLQEHKNLPQESIQQSVIMRMPNNQTVCSSPRYSCDYTKSKSPRAILADIPKYSSEQQSSANTDFFMDTHNNAADKLFGIKPVYGKSYTDDAILNCLSNGYPYEKYSQGSLYSPPSLQNKTYPGMPQAGYTSVIVDAQQYHNMSNGFVH